MKDDWRKPACRLTLSPSRLPKGPPVTECADEDWEPGAGGRRPGGSVSTWMIQGSGRHTWACRCATAAYFQIVERLISSSGSC